MNDADDRDYDSLQDDEQTLVRARWDEAIKSLIGTLRLDREFSAEGQPYVELDDDGKVVRRDPPLANRHRNSRENQR